MSRRFLAAAATVVAFLACIPCAGQAASGQAGGTTSAFTVSPSAVNFEDRDIGTSTAKTLTITNTSNSVIDLTVNISGENVGDFSQSSTCLSKLQPQSKCEVGVVFKPKVLKPGTPQNTAANATSGAEATAQTQRPAASKPTPSGAVKRLATLEVGDGKSKAQVSLTGNAFPNIAVSVSSVTLETPRPGTPAVAQNVTVSNYTESVLEKVTAVASDEFAADASGCSDIAPEEKCTVYVGYRAWSEELPSSGSLALTATLKAVPDVPAHLTRIVNLQRAYPHWFSFIPPATWLLFLISVCYFVGLVLVRWHMIAKPARGQVLAEIDAVRARVIAEAGNLLKIEDVKPSDPKLAKLQQTQQRIEEINALLDVAAFPFKHKRFRDLLWFSGRRSSAPAELSADQVKKLAAKGYLDKSQYPSYSTRVFNAVFWTRGQELAGWSLAHEAEIQFVALLPGEQVRARLETSESELRQINTPVTLALADRIRDALVSGEAIIVEQARHLLQLAQPVLESGQAPEAARDAALEDLRNRAANLFNDLGTAIANNPAGAADVNACQTRLPAILVPADKALSLTTDVQALQQIASLSQWDQDLLTAIAGTLETLSPIVTKLRTLLASLKTAAQAPAAQLNATIADCNKAIDEIGQWQKDAQPVVDRIQPAHDLSEDKDKQKDKPNAWQELRNLCVQQVSLTDTMTHATTPTGGMELVAKVLDDLKKQIGVVRTISQSQSSATMPDGLRSNVIALAKMSLLPASLLADIKAAVARDIVAPIQRWRAILKEALDQIYANADTAYYEVCGWHNRLIWLVICALVFIIAVGLAFPNNSVLLLVGAVGGLLSRLQRSTKRSPTFPQASSDSTWGSLFLSPLTGAFSAWGGILLIIVGLKFNLFGSALSLDWQNPDEPVTLALALLFGFSERFFDRIAKKLEDQEDATPAKTKATPSASAAKPVISSITPPKIIFGQEQKLTILGANFSASVKVTITDDTGAPKPQTQTKFNSATSVELLYNAPGTKAYTATVTVTNPDGGTATSPLNVTASAA